MRTVTITITPVDFWLVPEFNTIYPAYDLFFEHHKPAAENGDVDTLVVSGITYKSIFYGGVAKFYIGEDLRFNASRKTAYTAAIGSGAAFSVWHGASSVARNLPEILFSGADYFISMIPKSSGQEPFCLDFSGYKFENHDIDNIEISGVVGDFASVWFGYSDELPSNAKSIRILPICEGDKKVSFILQNGEERTWFLHVKRKTATFTELTKYKKITTLPNNDTTSFLISDGENEITTTLFIDGLRKNELNEISQLAVSRFVEIDGVRAEIVRRSAVISGNSRGGLFTIDVKGLL
ncbi:MAG: hypothetical protein EOM44_15245 [Bacteroidia bacterium]|nr:hypothetical protein [Bacteroidia bacterium]